MAELTLSVVLQAVDRLTKPGQRAFSKFARNSTAVSAVQRSVDRLGRTDTFNRMHKSVERANRALKDQEYRLRVIDRMEKKLEANDRRREKLKGKIVGAAAGVAAGAAPVVTAANVEDAEIRLRTVLGGDDIEGQIAKARAKAREVAASGILGGGPQGLIQAFDIQYALNSAGLGGDASAAGSDVVAKVTKITGGVAENVGEVIAGTYNNLADSMSGTVNEKLERIGELLTKTQFKFQLRDFNQLGEGLSYAAASAASAKIPIEQVATVIGVLNSAQVTGSRAGTAFAAVERNLGKAAEEFGFQIVRSADGQMDFIATLEELERSLSIYDDLDERNQAIQKTFGEEGRAGIVPLLQKLKELRAAQADVVEGSKGIIDANVKMFQEGGTGPWKRTTAAVIQLADSVGRSLLPTVNALLEPTAAVVLAMANFAEANPTVTAAIAGTVGGLFVLRAALLAGRFASLAFSSGLLGGQIGLLRFGGVLFGLARGAVPAVIAGIRAVTIAMATNPIGLIAVGIAAAAALIIANWDTVKEYLLKIWEPIRPYWEKFAAWVERIWGTISAPFEAIGNWFFGDGESSGAVQRAASAAKPIATAASTAVTAGVIATSPAAAGNAGAPVSVSITVNAAEGQDVEEIARQVAKIVKDQVGALHD